MEHIVRFILGFIISMILAAGFNEKKAELKELIVIGLLGGIAVVVIYAVKDGI